MGKKIIILLFLLFLTVNVYSQQDSKMKQPGGIKSVEDFLNTGRKNIIDLAFRQLKKDDSFRNFNINLFNNIHVYYDTEYVWVSFTQNVRYIPWNSAFAYGVTVFLYGQQGTSCSLLENPENQNTVHPFSFYQYSDNDRKTLTDILKFIKIDPKKAVNETITIYDTPEYYNIQIMNEYSGEFYKIRKSDMTIYDEWSEELELPEEEDDETMELE